MRSRELASASAPLAKPTNRLDLLRTAGAEGVAVEKELRRLLPLKTKAEYEPNDVAIGVATKAVDRALRCVEIAQTVAGSTR